ncbi:MAG: hypothetical protein ACLTR6_00215 [Clostridium fessum]
MILTGIPAKLPFLAPRREALEQGASARIGIRRWQVSAFLQCLCMTLLLMAVTAGGYEAGRCRRDMRWRGRKNWRRGG